MNGQMSFWDFAPEESIENIPEEEMVRRVGDAIGVKFVYDKFFEDYRAKVGKSVLTIHYSHYNMTDNHNLFISVGFSTSMSGAGAPVDSIKKAIEWFEKRR